MTSHQQALFVTDLAPACETGDIDAIKEVMDTYFHQLHTAISLFCVTDERYEKPFLPEPRDFMSKGYLHSFLASRRLMLMKNIGEGETFEYTYTISFDTQFPSFLRSRYRGAPIPGHDDALSECLRFLAPYRSGVGMEPYLFENNEWLDEPKVRETIEAYTQFRNSPEASLMEGRIESTLSETELASDVDATMPYLAGVVVQFAQESGAQEAGDEYVTRLVVLHLRILIGRIPDECVEGTGLRALRIPDAPSM